MTWQAITVYYIRHNVIVMSWPWRWHSYDVPLGLPFITLKISRHMLQQVTTSLDTKDKNIWFLTRCRGIFSFQVGGAAIYSCSILGCSVDESSLFLASVVGSWLSWDVVGSNCNAGTASAFICCLAICGGPACMLAGCVSVIIHAYVYRNVCNRHAGCLIARSAFPSCPGAKDRN